MQVRGPVDRSLEVCERLVSRSRHWDVIWVRILRNSKLTARDKLVGTTQLWALNSWFAARFVLDSRPPALSDIERQWDMSRCFSKGKFLIRLVRSPSKLKHCVTHKEIFQAIKLSSTGFSSDHSRYIQLPCL